MTRISESEKKTKYITDLKKMRNEMYVLDESTEINMNKSSKNLIMLNGRLYKEGTSKDHLSTTHQPILNIDYIYNAFRSELVRSNSDRFLEYLSEYNKNGGLLLHPFNQNEGDKLRKFYHETNSNKMWKSVYPKITIKGKDSINYNIEFMDKILSLLNTDEVVTSSFKKLESINGFNLLASTLESMYKFQLLDFSKPGKLENFCIKYNIRFTTYNKFLLFNKMILDRINTCIEDEKYEIGILNYVDFIYNRFFIYHENDFYRLKIEKYNGVNKFDLKNSIFLYYKDNFYSSNDVSVNNAPFYEDKPVFILCSNLSLNEVEFNDDINEVLRYIENEGIYIKTLYPNMKIFDIFNTTLIERREEEGNERTETSDNRTGYERENKGTGGEKQGSDLSE